MAVPADDVDPRYSELPDRDGLRVSWGRWGSRDPRGTLNRIDAAAALRGRDACRTGEAFSPNLPIDAIAPPLFGRPPLRHEVLTGGNNAKNDLISDWNTQSSTQWDGLGHVTSLGRGSYNELTPEELGVGGWGPIFTRAVLVDVARHRAELGRPIDPAGREAIELDDLRAAVDATGVALERGDVLLVRTGWCGWYRGLGQDAAAALAADLQAPGLSAREEIAAYLWDLGVAAVAADNPSLEAWPQGGHLGADERQQIAADPTRRYEAALHVRLLAGLGIPIGELWDLDAVADACARDQRWTMALASAPLNLAAAMATPANAVLIR